MTTIPKGHEFVAPRPATPLVHIHGDFWIDAARIACVCFAES